MKNAFKIGLLSMGLSFASVTFAESALSHAMQGLAKSSKAFEKAQTLEEAQTALNDMRTATQMAKVNKPKKLLKENVEAEKIQQYEQLFVELATEIEGAKALLEQGQLQEAKQHLEKIDALKKKGHRTYRF